MQITTLSGNLFLASVKDNSIKRDKNDVSNKCYCLEEINGFILN